LRPEDDLPRARGAEILRVDPAGGEKGSVPGRIKTL
jgi:hypothetical protein